MRHQISANRRLQHALSSRIDEWDHTWPSVTSDEEAQHIDQQPSVRDKSRSASVASEHPRELLQDTLWPLTHVAQSKREDLNPHAAPKAKVSCTATPLLLQSSTAVASLQVLNCCT